MKKKYTVWAVLIGVFLVTVLLAAMLGESRAKPYSTYSTEPDGTKAAYLLLEELGFQVERKTSRYWSGEGILIALGPEYLQEIGEALTIESDGRFTNAQIRQSAPELVELLWPYREQVIVFEEYGRRNVPARGRGDEWEEVNLFSIAPLWLKLALLYSLTGAFFLMFFYKQRVGKPLPARGFEGRKPLEGVYAMAGALEQAGTYKDCAVYYYRYRTQSGNHWDKEARLQNQLPGLTGERDALKLIVQIDQAIKEYRNES